MRAAELECRWAARRLGVPRVAIRSVTFEEYEGFRYSTYTEEPATKGANVKMADGSKRHIDVGDLDFGELLRELLKS